MKPETAKKIALARKLRREGWSYYAIRQLIGGSRARVRRWTRDEVNPRRTLI